MQQQQFIDLHNGSTCFGQFPTHHQQHKTVIYTMWNTVPRLLVGDPECGDTDYV